jgi:hypothetical protein
VAIYEMFDAALPDFQVDCNFRYFSIICHCVRRNNDEILIEMLFSGFL